MEFGIGRWISWWARVAPERDAIVFERSVTSYATLDEQVNRLANALTAGGVRAGDRLGVLLGNRPEFLVAMFACAKLGAVLVPLNVRLVGPELEYIVNDAGPKVIVSEAALAGPLSEIAPRLETVERFVCVGEGGLGETYADFIADASADEPVAPTGFAELAICYTSGTTGLPKGAVLTHDNVLWGTLQEILGFGLIAGDRHLVTVPLCFTGGLLTASMPIFHTGATLYLEPGFDPAAAVARIAAERITHMMGVPTMFAAIAQLPMFASSDFSSIKLLLVGAAPVPSQLVERYQSRGVTGFTNAYGLTEGTGFNLFLPSSTIVERPGAYLPACYTEAKVVDSDGSAVVPGESGELLLRGPCVMAGYWRNETATAETIRGGWLHTGDLVKLDVDGYYYPVDRIKDMIISGGLNVYPAEVESVVFNHPKLIDSTVIGLPDERWGEAVTIVAVCAPGELVSPQEVVAFCASKLADYKRPKSVIFVDALPRNAGGKVLKRDLREQFSTHYHGT